MTDFTIEASARLPGCGGAAYAQLIQALNSNGFANFVVNFCGLVRSQNGGTMTSGGGPRVLTSSEIAQYPSFINYFNEWATSLQTCDNCTNGGVTPGDNPCTGPNCGRRMLSLQ